MPEKQQNLTKKDTGGSKDDSPGANRQGADSIHDTGTPEKQAVEIGGPPGPEPTRFGDWVTGGRCTDF